MKRTLALFLSIAVCFSLLPVSALAAEAETSEPRPEESAEKVLGNALNGLVFDGTTWYYFANGQIDYDYTGLAYREDVGWWYVKNGTIDFGFTGFAAYSGITCYVEGGRVMVDYTGLAYDPAVGWRYVREGRVEEDYTGLAYREGVGWWYVKNGAIDFDYTGIGYAEGVGYWYCNNGTIDFGFTGFYNDANLGWVYVEGGAVQRDYTGLAYIEGVGWRYMQNGRVDETYTGLAYREDVGWWYVQDGEIDFDYTGIGFAEGVGYWYCNNGTIDFGYTGFYNGGELGWVYIEDGAVQIDYTGLAYSENAGWWYLRDGSIDFEYIGLAYAEGAGWWYVQNGEIDFDFTGVGYAGSAGYWFCRNGTIDFSFTGYYDDAVFGRVYVEGGAVQLPPIEQYPTITLGTTTADISTGGGRIRYCFVPPATGRYTLTSTGPGNTYGYLYDASGNELTHDDNSGEYINFSITYDLTAGSVYFYEVRFYSREVTGKINLLLSVENHDAQITSDPVHLTVAPNDTATFRVTATGHSLSYQWQILLSGAAGWENTTLNGCRTDTLSFTALQSYDEAQFRCAVTGNDGITFYSNPARLFVTEDSTKYRALLISEVSFDPICNRNQGDVALMTQMLRNVRGPSGAAYSITTGRDLTPAQVQNAIADTFSEATSQDVSLFFIATHGVASSGPDSPYAGALATYNGELIPLRDLASWLNAIPGKVIVILESCGSGAGIYADNALGSSPKADAAFCQEVIDAFAEIDSGIKSADPNTGELRINNKFYVLTASALQQLSWGTEAGPFNYFTKWLTDGVGTSGSIPADTNYGNSDGIVTLHELYSYISAVGDSYPFDMDEGTFYQTVKCYPENSSYPLFKRSA